MDTADSDDETIEYSIEIVDSSSSIPSSIDDNLSHSSSSDSIELGQQETAQEVIATGGNQQKLEGEHDGRKREDRLADGGEFELVACQQNSVEVETRAEKIHRADDGMANSGREQDQFVALAEPNVNEPEDVDLQLPGAGNGHFECNTVEAPPTGTTNDEQNAHRTEIIADVGPEPPVQQETIPRADTENATSNEAAESHFHEADVFLSPAESRDATSLMEPMISANSAEEIYPNLEDNDQRSIQVETKTDDQANDDDVDVDDNDLKSVELQKLEEPSVVSDPSVDIGESGVINDKSRQQPDEQVDSKQTEPSGQSLGCTPSDLPNLDQADQIGELDSVEMDVRLEIEPSCKIEISCDSIVEQQIEAPSETGPLEGSLERQVVEPIVTECGDSHEVGSEQETGERVTLDDIPTQAGQQEPVRSAFEATIGSEAAKEDDAEISETGDDESIEDVTTLVEDASSIIEQPEIQPNVEAEVDSIGQIETHDDSVVLIEVQKQQQLKDLNGLAASIGQNIDDNDDDKRTTRPPHITIPTSDPQSDLDDLEHEFDTEPIFERRQVRIKQALDPRSEYSMEDELGRGKFGTIYRCMEQSSGQKFAAKFVHVRRREDRDDVSREVEIMNVLQHKRLLQLFDAFDDGKSEMCLITELVEGGELFERIVNDDFELTEKKAAIFMRQICEGVQHMHSLNIVHLDMKPENILCVSRTGNRIKLIDFGLARRLSHTEPLRVMFGTPDFAAPEVLAYDTVSLATDMWSVGVICYVLLSGLSPFMGDSDIDTMANVTRATYDFEDKAFEPISDLAKDFISKLLVKDQSERLKPSECLQHPWLQRGGAQLEASLQERRNSMVMAEAIKLSLSESGAEQVAGVGENSTLATPTCLFDQTPSSPPSLDKRNLKKYVVRRKWHKTVHAIMALQRMGANLKL